MASSLKSALPNQSVPRRTAGLVLAGGQSRRMGQNKALLRVQDGTGQTLLQHMQQLLLQVGCEPVLVSGAAVGGLPDRVADAGPLAGIDSALHALAERQDVDQLLIVPVDMPGLPAEMLRLLCRAGDSVRAVHFQAAPLPLLLPNTAATRALVVAHLAASESRSVQAMANALGAQCLARPGAAAELDNLNTPVEWQQWLGRQCGAVEPAQESS